MKIRLLCIFILLACASPALSDQNVYFIQAMHTNSSKKAESAGKLLKQYGNVHIARQGDRHMVWIGPIGNDKEAVMIRNMVRTRHPDAFIDPNGPASFPATSLADPKPTPPVAVAKAVPSSGDRKQTKSKPAVAPPQDVKPPPAENTEVAKAAPVMAAASPAASTQPVAPPPVAPPPVVQPPVGSDPSEARPPVVTPGAAESVPPSPSSDTLLKEGMDAFAAHRYENAVEKLSLFLSLYPLHGKASSALITLAAVLNETKRPLAAIRLYSHVLDRYPDSPEEIEAMTALADIRIASPDLKPRTVVTGAKWFLDPVGAYDMALSRDLLPEEAERLQRRRIGALRRLGRYREAYTASGRCLDQHPATEHRHALLAGLRSDLGHLIGERFAAGDDIAVINLFLNGRRRGLIVMGDSDTLIKAARSYARSGMTEEARTILNSARHFAADRGAEVHSALEELFRAEQASAIPSSVIERWAMFEEGRRQVLSSNPADAEATLKKIKGGDQDEFWSKLSDYTLQDGVLTKKYRGYLKP
jgi:tetratricopeptide (TPR) repeat protein